jgi:hypothetical protein
MANTTFSGPVRSQNGFQEWDGTEWVPVGGGGGGGAVLIASLDVPLTLEFTEIGQMITVVNNRSESEDNSGTYALNFTCPLLTNPTGVNYKGKYLASGLSGVEPFQVNSDASMTIAGASDFLLQFVLAGVYDSGGMGGPQAYVNLTGFTNGEVNT